MAMRKKKEEEERRRKEAKGAKTSGAREAKGLRRPTSNPSAPEPSAEEDPLSPSLPPNSGSLRVQVSARDPGPESQGTETLSKKLAPQGASATRHSNKKLVKNAIAHVCLRAPVEQKKREAALSAIEACGPQVSYAIHFVRDPNLKYRGIYIVDFESGTGELIVGGGPKEINNDVVREFLKYDSGTKTFRGLESKSFSNSTDAVVLHHHVMKGFQKKPSNLF